MYLVDPKLNYNEFYLAVERIGGAFVPSTKPESHQPPKVVTQFEQDDNQIINLSSYSLTMSEKQVLKKGLTFVTTMRFDPFTWIKDLNLFTRKLRWRNFFHKNDLQKCQQLGISAEDLCNFEILTELSEEGSRVAGEGPFSDLKPTSSRMPPSCDFGSIDVFQKLVTEEINNIIPSLDSTHPNLTYSERKSLNDLRNNTSLVIKPSDKGGNTVIMDHENYTKMCMSILSDVSSYEILKGDPTADYTAELSRMLTRAFESKLISKSEFGFLLPRFPMVSTFYALPKIHKGYSPLKGRPIVSGVDALSQNSSIYLDRLLRPFVTALPSYIRDTSDLLTKLEGVVVEPDTIIASIDVQALYSSIRHRDGLRAIEYYISSRGVHCGRHNIFLLELLNFVLQRNYFLFGGKYYHQLRGTAMGSPCAPTYANLLLGWWEDTLIFKDEDETWSPRIIFWGRFIDDTLVLWRGDACSFSDFVAYLNTTIEGLFFTFEIGGQSINFLDVNICRQMDGSLSTTIFRKPTATNSLLRWESHHPPPLKRGIPKGQFLRLRRNCSSLNDFERKSLELKDRFRARGYPHDVIDSAYHVARRSNRTSLLVPKIKTEGSTITRLIGTFDDQSRRIYEVFKRHWQILKSDPVIGKFVSPHPSITYRRERLYAHAQFRSAICVWAAFGRSSIFLWPGSHHVALCIMGVLAASFPAYLPTLPVCSLLMYKKADLVSGAWRYSTYILCVSAYP
ncbi:unnamed protein product [Ranitomeya imitator]|uniref:Helix-turn-helix domain-containing protein n=1 Tax=Ranitomeya imitator TaxID=111125 RepID=A0ABN9M9L1_9NEOB|nr:unnamed protein product [Ranitomeya imitator]